MTRLEGKSALVTGAASGIGAAFARRLAKEGAGVTIVDLNGEGAERVAAEVRAAGGRAIAVTADATDDTAMVRAALAAQSEFGSLDVAYANAGIPCYAPLDEIDLALFQRVMSINSYSVVATAKAVVPIMEAQETGGVIVNTCSIAGKTAYPGHVLYASTKFATRAFTQGFAKELAPKGIRVNAICPGMVATPLWDEIGERMEREGDLESASDVVDVFAQGVLLGRPSTPADLEGMAVFLASDDAAYITGQCINVDGGVVFD